MRRRPGPALVALTALAVVLAACSSGGGADGSADPGTPITTTTARGGGSATTTTAAGDGAAAGPGTLARYRDYRSTSYDDPAHWVCRPDTPKDICHSDLDATVVAADGTLTVERFERAKDPKVDCFYVYPTISRDQTTYSDWDVSPAEEGFVTLNQAARLGSVCRVFAPVYRQLTLTALGARMGGKDPGEQGDPFADVLDAFRTYLAEDNGGRGFVLIGHSQGAGMLNQLIRTEIDPHPDVRAKLVGAYLAGGSVAVPDGERVGGDFAHVPLCSTRGEVGCVATWATFRSTAPPPATSFFGRPRGGKAGQVAGCVNPAAPDGGSADASSYFVADRAASIFAPPGGSDGGSADATSRWVDPSAGRITTPFVALRDLVSVRCIDTGPFRYLEATVHGDPADPRADDIPGDLTPPWGLHLVDLNLVMGDVVADVAAQADAYAG